MLDPADDPLSWLQAQPQAQAARTHPARWHALVALARRAARAEGALRTLLCRRLGAGVAALPGGEPAPTRAPSAVRPPLQALTATLNAGHPEAADGAWPELRAVRANTRDWTRLRVARRLADVPPEPSTPVGPLNAHALMPKALAQLQSLSPEYLQRLMQQFDVLGSLPRAAAAPAPAAAPVAVAAQPRKPAAGMGKVKRVVKTRVR
jgi:hypothetical protein